MENVIKSKRVQLFALVVFFLVVIVNLITNTMNSMPLGLIFGILALTMVMESKKHTIYDRLYIISLFIGLIIMFINIFLKNALLANLYGVYIISFALALFFYNGRIVREGE